MVANVTTQILFMHDTPRFEPLKFFNTMPKDDDDAASDLKKIIKDKKNKDERKTERLGRKGTKKTDAGKS